MTENDKKTIFDFANGDMSKKNEAVNIYYNALKNGDKSIETLFMSEVCNDVPDLALKADYRKKILEKTNDRN